MDCVELVIADLDVDPEAARTALGLLSQAEQERARRFVFKRDGRRFIVARARLRQLLAQRLKVPPEEVEFTYGAHGKPALPSAYPALRFNLSHCQEIAVYAFARGRDVGVDVEAVRRVREADEIAARFFTRRENDAYRALEARDRPLGFFNCWTRKEAFIKALGEGLSYPLHRFEVSLAPGEAARILRLGDVPGEDCGWSLQSFSPAPGFVAALVAQTL